MSILANEDRDPDHEFHKKQQKTRYCMGLMVYVLIFNLFLLRMVTLDSTTSAEPSPVREPDLLLSEKAFLKTLQVYTIANMVEYGLTLTFLGASLLFYD